MDKYAVVTGATKGIGLAVVEKLVANGFKVLISARTPADIERVQQTHAGKVWGFKADMAVKNEVLAFAGFVKGKTKSIEVLVNNAGSFVPGGVTTEPDGALEAMLNTNLASAYHLTRALLPIVSGEKPIIFNMCSTASITAYVNGGSYCLSKFALLGFSKVLREELKGKGIRVTALLPGAVLTDSWAGTDLPADRFMAAADIADVLYATYALGKSADVEEIVLRPTPGDI